MSVPVECPGCGAASAVSEDHVGRNVRCAECGRVFRAEAPDRGRPEPTREGVRADRGGPPRIPPRGDDERSPSRRHYDDDYRRPPPQRSSSAWVWVLVLVCVLPFFACAGVIVLLFGLGMVSWFTIAGSSSSSKPAVATVTMQGPIDDAPPPDVAPQPGGPAPEWRANPVILPPPPAATTRAPDLKQDNVTLPLPAAASAVAAGGAGRYLILNIPEKKQLAIFDANSASIAKILPAGGDDVLIAAGMDMLMVLHKQDFTVERWSLTTFEREAEGKLEMDVPFAAAAMGEASNGPLVVSGVDWPRLGETAFFDVLQMKRIDMPFDKHSFFDTSPDVFLRASDDGRVFASQQQPGNVVQTCVWTLGSVPRFVGAAGSRPMPGFDDMVCTTAGEFDPRLRQVPSTGGSCVPAQGGPYYLSLPNDEPPPPGQKPSKQPVSVCLAGDDRPFATLSDVDGSETADPLNPDKLSLDQRLHLIPAAKLLVSIPRTADKLVVRRFDPAAELAKSGLDYLAVTSRPPEAAHAGEEFAYTITTMSNKGGVTYGVESGPPDMRIDEVGRLTWKVPADYPSGPVDVTVTMKHASGRNAKQSFTVGVIGR
jgi:predicted Zn finger-like uncharacterized protein